MPKTIRKIQLFLAAVRPDRAGEHGVHAWENLIQDGYEAVLEGHPAVKGVVGNFNRVSPPEFTGDAAHFKRFGYDLAERTHDSDHTFAFGHIDPNSIHGHTSEEKNYVMWRPSKTHCRFNLLGKVNAKPNLLKPNAAIRGWLTISFAGVITLMEVRQANYPLIVA